MFNPLYVYIYSFIFVICVSLLPWSNIFPAISSTLYIFFFITFLFSLCFGLYFSKKGLFKYEDIKLNTEKDRFVLIAILIWSTYFLEGLYFGGFPLIGLINGTGGLYVDFGVPVLHVFLVTFHCFYITYYFYHMLSKSEKKVKNYINLLVLILPVFLIVNRAMMMIIIFNILFVYLSKLNFKFTFKKLKKIIGILCLIVIVLYAFGLMGNLRSNKHQEGIDKVVDSSYIMYVGSATDEFKDNLIPKPFFWGYVYIASPIANLQNTIDTSNLNITKESFIEFFNFQIIPDFIGKRIAEVYDLDKNEVNLVSPLLTVSTAFGHIYNDLGYLGMFLFYFIVMSILIIYLIILKNLKSKYFIVALASCNSIVLLFSFSNMWMYSGVSFQLFYPLILTVVSKFKS